MKGHKGKGVMDGKGIVGRRIRRLRIERGLTQQELASRAGINQGYLSEIERGKDYELGADKLARIAGVLDTNVEYLMARTDDARPPEGVFSEYPKRLRLLLARVSRLDPEGPDYLLLSRVVESLLQHQGETQSRGSSENRAEADCPAGQGPVDRTAA